MRKLTVRWLLCMSLSCVTALSATLASAAPDDGTVAIARERFREGVSLFDKKEYDKARIAFLQAYALKKHPAVLLNLAQSELRSNHEAEAAKHFAAYLREAKDASDAERLAAEAGLNVTKNAVAAIEVSVDEPFAEVYLDSTMEGLSPLPGPLYVNPGTHTVEARTGGKSDSVQIAASAGKQFNATLTFAVKPAPATPPEVRPAPSPAPEVSSPEHFEPSSGRKPFFRWLGSSPVGLVGVGLTGVGLGVGVGMAIASGKSYDNADSVAAQIKSTAATDSGVMNPNTAALCRDPRAWLVSNGYVEKGRTPDLQTRTAQYETACAKYPDNVSRGDTLKTLATVGFVVGGVAAVGTVVYYFLDPNAKESSSKTARSSRRRLALVPDVGQGQTGLILLGTF